MLRTLVPVWSACLLLAALAHFAHHYVLLIDAYVRMLLWS